MISVILEQAENCTDVCIFLNMFRVLVILFLYDVNLESASVFIQDE